MSELKPCKACGSSDHTRLVCDRTVFVEPLEVCRGCGHIEPRRTWNRRPPCAACAVMMSALEEIADTLEEDGSFHASVKAIREEMARAIAASGDGEVGDG